MVDFINRRRQELSESKRIAQDLTETNLLGTGATQSVVGDITRIAQLGVSLQQRKKGEDAKAAIAAEQQTLAQTEERLLGAAESAFETYRLAIDQGKGDAFAQREADKAIAAASTSSVERDFVRKKAAEFGLSPVAALITQKQKEQQNALDRTEREFGEIPQAAYGLLPALAGKNISTVSTEDMDKAIVEYSAIAGQKMQYELAEQKRTHNLNLDAAARRAGYVELGRMESDFYANTASGGLASMIAAKEEAANLPPGESEKRLDELRLSQITGLQQEKARLQGVYASRIAEEPDSQNRDYLQAQLNARQQELDARIKVYETSANEDILNLEQQLKRAEAATGVKAYHLAPASQVFRKIYGEQAGGLLFGKLWDRQTAETALRLQDVVKGEAVDVLGDFGQEMSGGAASPEDVKRFGNDVARFMGGEDVSRFDASKRDGIIATAYTTVGNSLRELDPSALNAEGASAITNTMGRVANYSSANPDSFDNSFDTFTNPKMKLILNKAAPADKEQFYFDHLQATNQRMIDPANGILRRISDHNKNPGVNVSFDAKSGKFKLEGKLPDIGSSDFGTNRLTIQKKVIDDAQSLVDKGNKYLSYMLENKDNIPDLAAMSKEEVMSFVMLQAQGQNINLPIIGTLPNLLATGEDNAP